MITKFIKTTLIFTLLLCLSNTIQAQEFAVTKDFKIVLLNPDSTWQVVTPADVKPARQYITGRVDQNTKHFIISSNTTVIGNLLYTVNKQSNDYATIIVASSSYDLVKVGNKCQLLLGTTVIRNDLPANAISNILTGLQAVLKHIIKTKYT